MNLKLIIILFCVYSIGSNASGQKTQIDCYIILNQVDKLLVEKDTFTAVRLYEAIDKENCVIKKGRYGQLSLIYYKLGLLEKSKEEMKKGIEHGLMGVGHFYGDSDWLQNTIRKRYGERFLQEMLRINQQIITEKLEKHRALIYELKEVYEADQILRKNKSYKECKNYDFRFRLGFPYDTTQNHLEMMMCVDEFKQKDSILLQRFVDIVDSLGFVPGDDLLFATIPIGPLVNHTAHFSFKNLDSLYFESVRLGTISPATYAWYQGYHEEYYKKEHQLYFTHGEIKFSDFSEEMISEINRRRLKIGLPPCPAVIWNVVRY